MSNEHNILGWNPVNTENQTILASCYIKPNLKTLELFNKAPMHNVLLQVKGTNSCYDGKIVFGTIDKSSDVPNCRQNLFNCTGLYVLTMDQTWMGYPDKNGTMTFFDGTVDKLINTTLPPPQQAGTTEKPTECNTLACAEQRSRNPPPPPSVFRNTPSSSSGDSGSSGYGKIFLIIFVVLIIMTGIFLSYKATANRPETLKL
jgi:hypothetical protein